MSIIDMVLSGQNGALVKEIANKFGIDATQAESAVSQLLPALSQGLKQNVAGDKLSSIMGLIQNGGLQNLLDGSASVNDHSAEEGNNILGQLLGSKDVSRQLASHVSGNTGVSSDILKQMLPVVASAFMGALGKKFSNSSAAASAELAGLTGTQNISSDDNSGIMGMITGLLDTDKDGSVADDILGMIMKNVA